MIQKLLPCLAFFLLTLTGFADDPSQTLVTPNTTQTNVQALPTMALNPKENTVDILDIRPLAKIPTPLWIVFTSVFCGLFIAGLLIWLLVHYIRQKRSHNIVPLSPYVIALNSINEALQFIHETNPGRFIEGLTGSVRQYLSQVFQLPAPEYTTEEVLEKIRSVDILEDPLKEEIVKFLQQCDLTKFANQNCDNPARHALILEAKSIIHQADNAHQKHLQKELEDTQQL